MPEDGARAGETVALLDEGRDVAGGDASAVRTADWPELASGGPWLDVTGAETDLGGVESSESEISG